MTEIVDYAIIGGGCAGTYTAWRLSTAFPNRSIHLYEEDRIGGRLLTLRLSGCSDVPLELGGMRYSPNQIFISSLLPVLKLDWKTFDYPMRFFYLRDYRFVPGATPPYHLDPEETSKSADELILFGIRRALQNVSFDSFAPATSVQSLQNKIAGLLKDPDWPRFSLLKASEWELIRRHGQVRGTALHAMGFWNLLHAFLSSEAYFFSHDGLGYQSVLANWNAAEAIPWFLKDFESPKYRTIVGGMERLPVELARLFEGGGGTRHVVHRLTEVNVPQNENEPFSITLWNGKEEKKVKIQVRHLVLALPKEALKRISFNGLTSDQLKKWERDLESVRGNPLFKLFLAYKTPWWQHLSGHSLAPGRAVTDLPIRQVYYYYGHEQEPTAADSVGGEPLALLMASYSDARYVDFWKPVLRRGDQPVYRKDVELSAEDSQLLGPFGASERMVRKAHRQIVNLHIDNRGNPNSIPEPCLGLVMDWSRAPFYAGWHTWEPRRRPWLVRQRMKQPFKGSRIYVCGEAFSCEQGWVEGALRSAELVVNLLGVAPPEWVPQEAYSEANFDSYEEYIT